MDEIILTSGLKECILKLIIDHFQPSDFRIISLKKGSRATAAVQQLRPLLIILGSKGNTVYEKLDQVRKIRKIRINLPIILMSKNSSEARATAAFRAGVSDYLKEPVGRRTLLNRINELLYQKTDNGRNPTAGRGPAITGPPMMIGNSPVMLVTQQYLSNVAVSDSTVLITGETGTGKGLAAETIHYHSSRSNRPLVAVNCAALPESLAESELFGYERGAFTGAVRSTKGKFAQADNSTLFLDEIGDMSPYIQAKILHTFERKTIYPLGSKKATPLNVRMIAATNQNPETLIAQRRFRKDLYYRLNVARVTLPPLRKRKEDIPALVNHGIADLNRRFNRKVKGLTQEVMAFFLSYDWPGNIRELMNVLEATYINLPNDRITQANLPAHFRNPSSHVGTVHESERQAIVAALMQTNWNKSQAARRLNWSRMTLYRKMSRFKITGMH